MVEKCSRLGRDLVETPTWSDDTDGDNDGDNVQYLACRLVQGTEFEDDFATGVNGEIIMPKNWFDNFWRANHDELNPHQPTNRESYREEWESTENMLVHYTKYEEACVREGIACVNELYDASSAAEDIYHISHQRIVYIPGELYRVHSYDETGWTPNLTDTNGGLILTGKGEEKSKV